MYLEVDVMFQSSVEMLHQVGREVHMAGGSLVTGKSLSNPPSLQYALLHKVGMRQAHIYYARSVTSACGKLEQ